MAANKVTSASDDTVLPEQLGQTGIIDSIVEREVEEWKDDLFLRVKLSDGTTDCFWCEELTPIEL